MHLEDAIGTTAQALDQLSDDLRQVLEQEGYNDSSSNRTWRYTLLYQKVNQLYCDLIGELDMILEE